MQVSFVYDYHRTFILMDYSLYGIFQCHAHCNSFFLLNVCVCISFPFLFRSFIQLFYLFLQFYQILELFPLLIWVPDFGPNVYIIDIFEMDGYKNETKIKIFSIYCRTHYWNIGSTKNKATIIILNNKIRRIIMNIS